MKGIGGWREAAVVPIGQVGGACCSWPVISQRSTKSPGGGCCMQVDWSTIEAIAATEAIDLWILFPLGQAVNRLLTKSDIPGGGQADRLTRFFGTDGWKEAFYEEASNQPSMFDLLGEGTGYAKRTTFEAIGRYFVDRLQQVFVGVSKNPLPLQNSKGVPLYLLCFAAANPKGAKPALRIANHLLRR
jgi:three-Cys-motif partner protein